MAGKQEFADFILDSFLGQIVAEAARLQRSCVESHANLLSPGGPSYSAALEQCWPQTVW